MPTADSVAHTLARLRAGELDGTTRLDLRHGGLAALPPEVLRLADTLEVLDLSGNALTALPDSFARLTRLHTLFASNNHYTALPGVLGRLPALDTLGFKANRIETVPPESLAPSLRWLILTDNCIGAMPQTLTECRGMQKLMLAGNRLEHLPRGLGHLSRLELLRLAANRFARIEHALPDDLLTLPNLAWLAHAGNPFSVSGEGLGDLARESTADASSTTPSQGTGAPAPTIDWRELTLQALLGEGASGHIHAARWQPPGGAPSREVAVKLFKGAVTSDGLPACEIAATLAAGSHPHLVGVLGTLGGHPHGTPGLVLPRLAAHWSALAGPPSMQSCSRDVYSADLRLSAAEAGAIARGAEAALDHLHARGLTHGDLYAHNLLVDGQGGALLSDFGAASFLPEGDASRAAALWAIDRRALSVLQDELAGLVPATAAPQP